MQVPSKDSTVRISELLFDNHLKQIIFLNYQNSEEQEYSHLSSWKVGGLGILWGAKKFHAY